MNRKPEVSVIIPCYNHGQYIDEAVDSVLAQTFQNFEINIVNDCSTDGSEKQINAQLLKDPRIHVINHEVNKGLPASRNTGIRPALGRYISTLDADDTFVPDALMKCYKAINFMNLDIIYYAVQEFGTSHNILKAMPYNFDRLLLGNFMPSSIFFFKKHWEEIGGYNETMTDGYEDWEFNIHMGEHGHFGLPIKEPLLNYRVKEVSMVTEARKIHMKIYNKIKLIHKETYDRRNQATDSDGIRRISEAESGLRRTLEEFEEAKTG